MPAICHAIRPLLATLLATLVPAARGGEGMWLFNAPPGERLLEDHGVELSEDWLLRMQRASVNFGGGSGSFISPRGLVLTNHHVGRGAIQRLSTPERDLLRDGFTAASVGEEIPVPGLELSVLVDIRDVTDAVNSAVATAADPAAAITARAAAIAGIEADAAAEGGLRGSVVTLHQGGLYHLYRYHRYTDVRLVWAPENQIGYFGGNIDNFEYPRWVIDAALFRVYEDGEPAETPDFLPVSTAALEEEQLLFVSGHPGRTNRQLTLAEVRRMRDHSLPEMLARLHRSEVVVHNWSLRAPENARRASSALMGIGNGHKARGALLASLQDPAFFERIERRERQLRDAVAADPQWASTLDAWAEIEDAAAAKDGLALRFGLFEGMNAFGGSLAAHARWLVRAARERPLPGGERLREFRDSVLPSRELRVFANDPVYHDLEEVLLASSLGWMIERLGADDPLVVAIMGGLPPADRAAALIQGTRLDDPARRREIYDAAPQEIDACDDPLIALMRLIEPEARDLRRQWDELSERKEQAYGRIARARFAIEGDRFAPDATGTLRLSYGVVRGYTERGAAVPFQTTLGGLFERSEMMLAQSPFDLPARWLAARASLDPDTPMVFVSTHDIVGGNSGSPIVNLAGEVVGTVFDGNIHSPALNLAYDDERARTQSVHMAAVIAALRITQGGERLIGEMDLRE